MVVAVLGGLNLLDVYLADYIKGVADYIISWFPAFFPVLLHSALL